MSEEYKNFIELLKLHNIRPVEFYNEDHDEHLFDDYDINEETTDDGDYENIMIYSVKNLKTGNSFNIKLVNIDSNPKYPDLGYSFDEYKEVVRKKKTVVVGYWDEV